MYYPVLAYSGDDEAAGEFYVYELSTSRTVVISNVAGTTWNATTNLLTAGTTVRSQPAWMRTRQRAGHIAELSTTDPFQYTDDRSTTAWSSVSVGIGTIYPLIYNPDADRLVGADGAPAGFGHIVYSDDGGATWDTSVTYPNPGTQARSYGAWSRARDVYVFADLNRNAADLSASYTSTTGISGWTMNTGAFAGDKGVGINTIAYAPTLNGGTFCVVSAQGQGGLFKSSYLSTDGASFSKYTISADAVSWASVIWVPHLTKFLAIAGWSPSALGGTTSNLSALSSDGQTWTVSANMPSTRAWYRLAYNGALVACVPYGPDDKVAVTADGTTWTQYTMGATYTDPHIGSFFSTPV